MTKGNTSTSAPTIQVSAHNAKGVCFHTFHAANMDEVRGYCVTQSAAPFVDGFSIQGLGIVRVTRDSSGKPTGFRRLIGNEFVNGGPEIIGMAE